MSRRLLLAPVTSGVLLGAALLLSGCAPEGAKATAPSPPAPVRTVLLAPETALLSTTVVGTLEPAAKVVIAAQEEGVVTAIDVREGDRVNAGDRVVQLDDRRIRAELAEAEARLLDARAQARRAEVLERDGLIPASEAETIRASAAMAEARAEILRTRTSFTRITAPVAGTVVKRHVEVGNLASARTPLLELAAGPGLVLRVPVSELDVVHLRTGDRASVRVDALPGVALAARVARIFPAAEGTTRQVTVELALSDPPEAVRPGFLARADLVLQKRAGVLLVPETALQRGSETPHFVWVAEGDVARVRPVEPAERVDGRVIVRSGLAVGDEVVVEGFVRLKEGGALARQDGGGKK